MSLAETLDNWKSRARLMHKEVNAIAELTDRLERDATLLAEQERLESRLLPSLPAEMRGDIAELVDNRARIREAAVDLRRRIDTFRDTFNDDELADAQARQLRLAQATTALVQDQYEEALRLTTMDARVAYENTEAQIEQEVAINRIRGSAFEGAKDYPDALSCYERIGALRPGDFFNSLAIGRCLRSLGRLDAAVAIFSQLEHNDHVDRGLVSFYLEYSLTQIQAGIDYETREKAFYRIVAMAEDLTQSAKNEEDRADAVRQLAFILFIGRLMLVHTSNLKEHELIDAAYADMDRAMKLLQGLRDSSPGAADAAAHGTAEENFLIRDGRVAVERLVELLVQRQVLGWLRKRDQLRQDPVDVPEEIAVTFPDVVPRIQVSLLCDSMQGRAWWIRKLPTMSESQFTRLRDSLSKEEASVAHWRALASAFVFKEHPALEGLISDSAAMTTGDREYWRQKLPSMSEDEVNQLEKILVGERRRLGAIDAKEHGNAAFDKGDLQKAADEYTEAIRLAPTDADAHVKRARAWSGMGEYERAITDYDDAIRLAPGKCAGYNGRAWLRSTCPVAHFRDGRLAVQDAKQACEAAPPKATWVFDTLAAAYAEVGDFERAVKWQEAALDGATPEEHGAFAGRLELYRSGRPYRESR